MDDEEYVPSSSYPRQDKEGMWEIYVSAGESVHSACARLSQFILDMANHGIIVSAYIIHNGRKVIVSADEVEDLKKDPGLPLVKWDILGTAYEIHNS